MEHAEKLGFIPYAGVEYEVPLLLPHKSSIAHQLNPNSISISKVSLFVKLFIDA